MPRTDRREHYEVWKLADGSSEYELLHFRAGREVPDTVSIGTRAHCVNEAPTRPTRVDRAVRSAKGK